jgi:cob(I)alamin adenosyltransferase
MNKPQPIHQALQTIDDINAFIQALRAATHEDDIKAICDSQIAYILIESGNGKNYCSKNRLTLSKRCRSETG